MGMGPIKLSAAAEWYQDSAGMENSNFFCQIPVATENVDAVIEDILEFEMQELEMNESDDDAVCKKNEESNNGCADNENSAIGWDSMAETEQSGDEMQEGKPVVDKNKISGGPREVNYLEVIKKYLHENLEFNSAVLSSNLELELNEQVPALAVDEAKSKSGNSKHADSGCNQMRQSLFEKWDRHPLVETYTGLANDSEGKDSFSPTARDNRMVGLYEVQETEGDGGNDHVPQADEGSVFDEYAFLAGSASLKLMTRDMDQSPSSSHSGFDGEIVSDSDEMETDEEGTEVVGKGLIDSPALASLLKTVSSAAKENGCVAISDPDENNTPVEWPPGSDLTLSPSLLRPAQGNRHGTFNPAAIGESEAKMNEEEKLFLEKVQTIKLKYLRIAQRLGHSPQYGMTAPVFHKLGLSERIRWRRLVSQHFGLMSTDISTAMQMKTAERDNLDFSCNILVIGKTGVGKSATINSIFGEKKSPTSAFEPMTTSVKEICGTVDGVKLHVIDTPGLKSSLMEQNSNKKILLSVNKLIKKFPPDVVLYVDRLDIPTSNHNDLPILELISCTLGSSIWQNSIIVLTHAASELLGGPDGASLSYNRYIAQMSHIVQHSIRQVCGDCHLMARPLNPVALVENHPSCRRNRDGQPIRPNGQRWRSQLLLLCYSLKISSEAKSLLKPQDPPTRKLFGLCPRRPYLPFLLSSFMQARACPQISTDLGGTDGEWDVDLADLLDSTQGGVEDDDDYDQLPSFKPPRNSQIAQLTREQRKAYLEEYDYRVKLFQKKQRRKEFQKLKELKKRTEEGQGDCRYYANLEEVTGRGNEGPSDRPIPLPDMVFPLSFDGDHPSYRYRFLEITPQLLTGPILSMNGWDHDCGYDGISLEETLAIANGFPASTKLQITKDKREFSIHLDSAVSTKHGQKVSTLAGFNILRVGKKLDYIQTGETKFKIIKKNRAAAHMSVAFLGDNVATGIKVEDQISIGWHADLLCSTGVICGEVDTAYAANMEVRLRDENYPICQDQSTLALSLVNWQNHLAFGADMQSQFALGRNSKMAIHVRFNSKLSGQITVRMRSSEQLQIALVGVIPLAISVFRNLWAS